MGMKSIMGSMEEAMVVVDLKGMIRRRGLRLER
jgi:hypothetical protein